MRWIALVTAWMMVSLTALLGDVAVTRAGGVGTEPPIVAVHGVKHFSNKQVTRLLNQALWHQAVYGVAYGWEDPSITLPHMTTAAYRQAGFRDVIARAERDMTTATVDLEVEEGPQFLAGSVRIEGATQIVPEQLISRLGERMEPRDSRIGTFIFENEEFQPLWVTQKGENADLGTPLWLPDQPIAFNASGDMLLADRIEQVVADLGYPQARVRLGMSSSREGVLDLAVHIEDEGTPQTADTIEILGIERNTREEVLDFLQIEPGIPLDRQTRIDLTRRLWQSARFTSIDVMAARLETQPGTTLRIALEEYEKAPPLHEELSEAEEIAVRLHEWVATLPQSKLAFRHQSSDTDGDLAVLFAPGRAIALQSDGVRVLFTPEGLGYYSDYQNAKLQIETGPSWFRGSVDLKLAEDRSDSDSLYSFQMNYKWSYPSEHKPNPRPGSEFGLHIPPVMCLALLNGRATDHAIEDGVLSIRSPKETLQIEANTGRLLEFRLLEEDGTTLGALETVEFPVDNGLPLDWAEVATYEDALNPTSPVSSSIHLAIRDLKAMGDLRKKEKESPSSQPRPDFDLLLELADQALLATIDDFVALILSETQQDQSYPSMKIPNLQSYLRHAEPKGDLDWYPLIASALSKNLFPEDSWMADHALAASSAMADYDRMEKYYSNRVFRASHAGPLRDICVADYLQRKDPNLAHLFATRGLALLDLPGFQRDRDILLDETAYFGRFLLHAAETLKKADDKAIEALLASFFDEQDPGLTAAFVYLRFHKDLPAWQTLPEALDVAWEAGWKRLVEAKLTKIEAATRPKQN